MLDSVGNATIKLKAASAMAGIRVNRFRLVTVVFSLNPFVNKRPIAWKAHILWQTPVRPLDFTMKPPSAVKGFLERMFASNSPLW
jgi:hypothetical protein